LSLIHRLTAYLEDRHVLRALKVLRVVFVLGVAAYLIARLTAIGWGAVWASLPRTPWFYLLFAAMFFALPVSELAVYRLIWGVDLLRSFPVFVRKRVYNSTLIGYSGELYLFVWARQNLGLADRRIFSTIKDNNVLSTLASTTVTVGLLLTFMATGQMQAVINADPGLMSYFLVTTVIGALLIPVVIRFHRHLVALPASTALAVLAIHVVRLVAVLGLQVAQWAVVLTSVPFQTWLIFLTAQAVLTRIPFLPNKDLVFLGVGLGMAGIVDAPVAATAGMLLAGGALTQGTNLAMYLLTSFTAPAPRAHA
jgi:hypothetical protein